MRGLMSILALLALLVSPFGRAAAAEAVPAAHHSASAMAGHCDEGAAPDQPQGDVTRTIDCMIACATVAAADAAAFEPVEQSAPPLVALPIILFTGLGHGADPPPPRFS